MPDRPDRLTATRLYRAGVWLCPPAFRRDYGGQMLQDYADARHDAAASGRPADRWRFRAQMFVDLARTISWQWVRSGIPIVALVSAAVPLLLAQAITGVFSRIRFDLPAQGADADAVALFLIATTTVMLVASTITIAVWAAKPARRRQRRR